MFRLRGKTIEGKTQEFTAKTSDPKKDCTGDWWIKKDGKLYIIDPATIEPADDPRNAIATTPNCVTCSKMPLDNEYRESCDDLECFLNDDASPGYTPREDPRKAMLDEIREWLNADIFSRPPVNSKSAIQLALELQFFLDEMEGKL